MSKPRRRSWLPSEREMRSHVERQRAEWLRHGSRLDTVDSIYAPLHPSWQVTRPLRHASAAQRTTAVAWVRYWMRRLLVRRPPVPVLRDRLEARR